MKLNKGKIFIFFIAVVFSSAIFLMHQYLYSTRQIRLVLVFSGILYFLVGILIKKCTYFKETLVIIGCTTFSWWLLVALTTPVFDGPFWIWILDILFIIIPLSVGAFVFNEKKMAVIITGIFFLCATYFYVVPKLDFLDRIEYIDIQISEQAKTMIKGSDDKEGSVYFLDFWFTNCGYCYMGFRDLQELHESFKSNPSVKIIAIHNGTGGKNNINKGISKVRELGYSFPIIVDSLGIFNEMITSYPSQTLVGKDGVIKLKISGYSYDSNSYGAKQVKKSIYKLLKE